MLKFQFFLQHWFTNLLLLKKARFNLLAANSRKDCTFSHCMQMNFKLCVLVKEIDIPCSQSDSDDGQKPIDQTEVCVSKN